MDETQITEWFYDEQFVAALIRFGLSTMLSQGSNNMPGIMAYLLDEHETIDAKLIVNKLKQ